MEYPPGEFLIGKHCLNLPGEGTSLVARLRPGTEAPVPTVIPRLVGHLPLIQGHKIRHGLLQKMKLDVNSWRNRTGLESGDIKGHAPHLIHIFYILFCLIFWFDMSEKGIELWKNWCRWSLYIYFSSIKI